MRRVACLQMNSTDDVGENLATIGGAAAEAEKRGVAFLACPEMALYMDGQRKHLRKIISAAVQTDIEARLKAIARRHHLWLLVGLPAPAGRPVSSLVVNRSLLISPSTQMVSYDKVHLFDVQLSASETYGESKAYAAGTQLVAVDTSFGRLGLSICYDVRFPALYDAYRKSGCQVISVPSAFAVPTGQYHWSSLLRARAIETGAMIIAPAQCGAHPGDRKTYGHSMIVGADGVVLAEAGDQPGMICADIESTT